MKKFIHNICKNFQRFLFFSSYVVFIFAMDSEQPISTMLRKELVPRKTFPIFDPKRAFELHTITPDEQGVVIAECGQVRYLNFGTFSDPEVLFEHPHVKHVPMIAMAQKKDTPLLIVSAGNYANPEAKGCISEYIVFIRDRLFKNHKLNHPIQTMRLNPEGDILAIAGNNFATIIDLKNNKFDKILCSSKENWFEDIAIGPDSMHIVCAENRGAIQLRAVHRTVKNINTSLLKQVETGDIIKKINYSSAEELLYLTHDGKAKTINMYDLLENSPVDLRYDKVKKIEKYELTSIVGGNVTSKLFADSVLYNLVAVDQGLEFSTVHWTDNIHVAGDDRRMIEVHRRNNECVENFILTIPTLEEKYNYITENRQCCVGIGHVLLAELCGRHVVALGTDGRMYLWILPEKSPVHSKVHKDQEVINRGEGNDRIRRRSKTFPEGELPCLRNEKQNGQGLPERDVLSGRRSSHSGLPRKDSKIERAFVHNAQVVSPQTDAGDGVEKEKKKSSPRFKLKISSGAKSKESSPPLGSPKSREGSTPSSPK